MIFIWEISYKETKKKKITFKYKNNQNYSMILQNCTPELEGELKGIDNYNTIKTDKYGI